MSLKSEDSILEIIDAHFPGTSPDLVLGRGDDCAILGSFENLAISADLFLEDVHFRRSYFSAGEIGWKALTVNLSDLAAMGAKPLAFTLSLGLPQSIDSGWLDGFFSGMALLAKKYGIALAGGDLSRSDKIHVSISVFGEVSQKGALLRGVAKPGDSIFVVGNLGLAKIGLEELEKNGRSHCQANWPEAFMAHVAPNPLVPQGLMLAELARKGLRIGLMDVSDGLARDLPRLAGNGAGADLRLEKRHLAAEVLKHAGGDMDKACMGAAQGGEDYALAGTCPAEAFPEIEKMLPGSWLAGRVTATGRIFCNGKEMNKGFDHFA